MASCHQCSASITGRSNKKYCSAVCRNNAYRMRHGMPLREHVDCHECGKRFFQNTVTQVFCSNYCQQRAGRRRRGTLYQPRTLACEVCHSEFKTGTSHATNKYCSKTCQRKAFGSFWVSWERRAAIYERDKYICHLCGFTVESLHGRYDTNGAVLDHLKPRSLDGSDDDDNLHIAHYICNLERGNRPLTPEQQARLAP